MTDTAISPATAAEAVVRADSLPPAPHRLAFVGRLLSRPATVIGLFIVVTAILLAILVPWIFADMVERIDFRAKLVPPLSGWHILGTDQLGRDLLIRISAGLRTSFAIGFSAVALALVVGIGIGLVSGYFGGWIDTILMRFTDVQMALPFIVLAVAILSVAQPGYASLTLVLSLSAWPSYARVTRSVTQVERRADHVQAALALGAGSGRILLRYLLPPIAGSALILSILDVAAMIIYESTLGFIAIGVPPGTPSLGSIMADGKIYISTAWWVTGMPGLVILVTILGLNLIAIGLRQSLAEARQR